MQGASYPSCTGCNLVVLRNRQFQSHSPQHTTLFRRQISVRFTFCILSFGESPASEFYVPKFRNTLSVPSSQEVCLPHTKNMGLNSSVGIARHATNWTVWISNPNGQYGFPHPSRPALRRTQPPVQLKPDLILEGEAAGTWRSPSNSSRTEVKKIVRLYFYSTSQPSGLFYDGLLHLPLPFYSPAVSISAQYLSLHYRLTNAAQFTLSTHSRFFQTAAEQLHSTQCSV